ncbi:MAG TPA: right-handed parallel beta-helix repeat-containing protein, partial [Planctomycetota bacterium]|nr:right-handed parallel beta-helix repeat-containing protein [Planctomycetota bacterium]
MSLARLTTTTVTSDILRSPFAMCLVLLFGVTVYLGGAETTTPPATGATWHVAVDGNDTAAGTLERPFASLMRAQQAANPGDTVLIRGGTYHMSESQIAEQKDIYARIFTLSKSGSPGKRITYRAYPGEEPIFDCNAVKPALRVTAFYVSGSWIHVDGLTVTGVQVTLTDHTQSICFENQGSNNRYERLRMHHGQAIGIYSVRGSDNLFLNCDAWANWDHTSENGKGGNVDGFGCHPPKGSTGNVFRGCRAWLNSDDGYDLINAQEAVIFENCWAFNNG